ncbi:hypothetical protein [Caldithrix abyssi]
MTITFTDHALRRKNQRAISDTMILAVRAFGDKIYAQNSLYFFMSKRALKRMMKTFRPDNPEKWEGLTLVCDPKTEKVLTVFKNKRWLKKIRYH